MNRMLYVGMTGAKHTQMAQAVTINNLANASTPGFRGDFHSLLTHQVQGAGQYDSRFNVTDSYRGVSTAQGDINHTGRDLDVAIQGSGWIAVQGKNGEEGYTRRGDLQITAEGVLQNGAGELVLGEGGPITIPQHQSLQIGRDGTISIVPLGNGPETLVSVGRIRVVDLDEQQIIKSEDGLVRQINGEPGTQTLASTLHSGNLESSNISAVEALVSMIDFSRQYEMQVKMMQTSKDMADSSQRLVRME